MINLKDFMNKLLKEKRVAIFMHVRPDGDTIGSALALKFALENQGIKADAYCSDDIPSRFLGFKGVLDIKKELSGEYSAMVSIDCAEINRLGDFAPYFNAHKNTYLIDHHISNVKYAKQNVLIDRASNCENVYELLTIAGLEITKDISNLLLLGIVTDTGNFKHKNVSSETLLVASKLLEKGADINYIVYKMFTEQSKERAKLFGLVCSKIRYFLDDRFAVMTVSSEMLKDSNAKADETEGFIDFLMGVKSVEVGACVLEMAKNTYKISFRSKGTDVNAVAGVFGGGGHVLASGCRIQGEYEEVIDKIYCAVKRFIRE